MLCGNQGEAKSIYNPTSHYVNEIIGNKEENLSTLLMTIWILEMPCYTDTGSFIPQYNISRINGNESHSLLFAFKS